MTRHSTSSSPSKTIGSRAEVMHGTAKKTSGGLTKSDLKYTKDGRIVSRKASDRAKRNFAKMSPELKSKFKAQQEKHAGKKS